jgi:hypothetical protein
MAKGPALFLLPALFALRAVAGPVSTNPAPDYAQIGTLDQAAGRASIEKFRDAGLPVSYMEFVLSFLPRRGDEISIPGRLWADRNEQGPVLRIVLNPGAPDERRWLLQGGPRPAAWRRDGTGETRTASLTDPLWDGWETTPFDLEMPLMALYWPDETLVSINKVNNRPANAFVFRPPAAFVTQHPDIGGVRAYFDIELNGPEQTELLAPNGHVLKSWILRDWIKVSETWIPKQVDVRNEDTRDKTRYELTGAAVNIPRSAARFDSARLGDDSDSPRPSGFVDFRN